jgi:hypothetical protein
MPRGVRLNPQHDERTRAKIQTSQIINRLNAYVKGDVVMEAGQVTAALGLLRKTIPDLSATTLDAGDGLKEALKGIKVTFESGD